MQQKLDTARFGNYEFHLPTLELRRKGEPIRLQHQPALVLLLLVSNAGRTVTRDELQTTIWNDRVVELDANLNFTIHQLRSALGDSAECPAYIETLPRQGYRFIAEVEFASEAQVSPRQKRVWLGLASAAVLAAVLMTASRWQTGTPSVVTGSERLKIAVLPFQELDPQQSVQAFARGLTEDLITDLATLSPERLGVIAYSSARGFAGEEADGAVVGEALGVDFVVRGAIRQSAAQRRVTIRVESTEDGSLVWARRFDRQIGQEMDAQKEIAQGIATALSVRVLDKVQVTREGELPQAVQEALLVARWFLGQGTQSDFERALVELGSVFSTDPEYAPAWALAADAHWHLKQYDAAESAARKAVELNDQLAEAHYQLGQALLLNKRPDEAFTSYQRAVELSPGVARYREAIAYQLWRLHRLDEAIQHMEFARELDPLSTSLSVDLGEIYISAGSMQEAVAHCKRSLRLQPENLWGRLCLLKAEYLGGDLSSAVVQAKEILRRQEATAEAFAALADPDPRAAMLAYFTWTLRRKDEMPEGEPAIVWARSRNLLAKTHAMLEERAATLAALTAAGEDGDRRSVQDRWLSFLWRDPEFEELLRRADLAIPWQGESAD